MKRFLIVLMMMTAILFTSCASRTTMESAEADLGSPFECDMKMIFEDNEFGGKLRKIDTGIWEADFTSPDTLEGVLLSINGNDVTASYKGLSFTVPKKALPVKSVLLNFISAVDKIAESEETEGTENDGIMLIDGENESGEYTLGLDMKTGDLCSFEMKNFGVKMEFENFTVKEAPAQIGEAVSDASEQSDAQPETEVQEQQ